MSMEQPKPYEPSEEETKKVEEMMTEEQKSMSKEREATLEAGYLSRVKDERGGRAFITIPIRDPGVFDKHGVRDVNIEATMAIEIAKHLKKGDYLKITRKDGRVDEGIYTGIDTFDAGYIKLANKNGGLPHTHVGASDIRKLEKENL